MKKGFFAIILCLIFISIVTVCTIGNNGQKNTNKLEMIDKSEVMLAYRVTNYAWGKVDYVYIISGSDVVKKIDLIESNKLVSSNLDFDKDSSEFKSFFDKCMSDDNIAPIAKIGEIPEHVINKVMNISEVNLFKDNKDLNFDRGSFTYFAANTIEVSKFVKLQVLGDMGYKSKDQNIVEICEYVDEIIRDINS